MPAVALPIDDKFLLTTHNFPPLLLTAPNDMTAVEQELTREVVGSHQYGLSLNVGVAIMNPGSSYQLSFGNDVLNR